MPASESAIARFGGFRLNLQSGELWNGADRTLLPDQPLRILRTLVLRPGTLVTRDELRRELWADDTFVDFEHGLNAAIKRLREVLGDSAAAPRFIETIPRRGYRFIAKVDDGVEPVAEPTHPSGSSENDPGFTAANAASPADAPIRSRVVWAAAVVAALLFGAFLAQRSLRGRFLPSASRDLPTPRLVQLTSTSGLNIDPALSPDGSLVAYASNRAGAGNLDIWVQPVGGDSPVRITSGSMDEIEPSFSPDGARIVFVEAEGGGIYVVGALGGEPRLLVRATRAHTPRFSPDGKWVAYWTGLPVGISRAAGASGGLFLVPAAGGSPQSLLPSFASARHPVWSPDGRQLLVVGERRENIELDWYLVPLDGGEPIKTGAFKAFREAGAILDQERPIPTGWTSAGDAVVMATMARTTSNIWQLPISSATGQVAGVPKRLTFGTAIERSPSAARGRVAFASLAENVDIWRLSLNPKTGMADGALERVTENPAVDQVMNLTADGKTMAFVSSRTGRNEVWTKDMDSGVEHQLTSLGVSVAHISPDGSRVALWGFGPGTSGVQLVDLPEGAISMLCRDCERAFGWAPSGSRVLLAKAKPSRLFAHDFATGRESMLAGHPTWFLREGRFSPDGRWVAFYTANTPDQRQIHIVPSSPASPIPLDEWLTVVEDVGSQPNWSADGSLLYYMSERDGTMCFWEQQLDPLTKHPIGPPQAVQHFHNPRLRAGTGAIATNDVQGGYLYVTLTEMTGNVWMLDGVNK